MKGKLKNFIMKLIAGVLVVSMAGCGEAAAGDRIGRDPENPPVYQANETFRTAAWSLPPNENTGYGVLADNPDYATVENYQIMKDCGFDYALPTSDYNDSHILNTLEKAEAVGMKVLVRDYSSFGIQQTIALGGTYAEARENFAKKSESMKARYDKFKEYESFAGVLAYDEPDSTLFPAIAAAQDWFLKYYPEYEFYVNLLPNYATPKQLFGVDSDKGYTYADHVSMFVDEVNPMLISYDHYALLRDAFGAKYLQDDFFYNLYLFAEQAKEKEIPFYIYLQTMGFYDNVAIENYAEFGWQCYTSMAFGVTGIQCFCYWTLLEEESLNNVHSGIVDRDGTILPTYYIVQEVFNEIKSFEQIYMSFDWDGFKLYEGSLVENSMFGYIRKNQLEKLKGVREVSVDQDVVIGQFLDEEGYPGFMVANASSPFDLNEVTVTMTFDDDVTAAQVYVQGEMKTVNLTDHRLTLELESGGGCFVLPL